MVRNRLGRVLVSIFLMLVCLPISSIAQSDRGTITGTVTDPTGAIVPNAPVLAKSSETGAEFRTVTTSTGNYTIPSVPAGTYSLTVEAPGFMKHVASGLRVQVAVTARIDVALQIGNTTDSVTVEAAAPMLRTESAEQSTTLSKDRLNALPMNFSAQSGGALRNALTFAQLTPGAYIQPGSFNSIRVNGSQNQTFKILLDGQDTTNGLTPQYANNSSPSVDAIEEFTLQTSNFAAEFGQVAGGLFNFTSRSGSNQFHGTAYEYFANEALNAGQPYSNDGSGHLIRGRVRKNDFGGTFGGPVYIPKIYDGRNKTFFFFSYEAYLDRKVSKGTYSTVPTDAMRNGDFSAILGTRVLNTDPLGRPIIEGTIYDPATRRTVNGKIVTDPFQNNTIPLNLMDPVALKIQALIPKAHRSGTVNNYEQTIPQPKTQTLPSIKIDHSFGMSKLSFYYMQQRTDQYSGADGLPIPITQTRFQFMRSNTVRLNFDRAVTPTLLVHAGVGFQHILNPDSSPAAVTGYDAVGKLGLVGGATAGFPRILGASNSFGGMSYNMGPGNVGAYYMNKPTGVLSATWVKGNHTIKGGAEWARDAWTNRYGVGAGGIYNFSGEQTTLPWVQGQNLQGGSIGNGYASFLLGRVSSASVSNWSDPQLRKSAFALFLQDTWKVTRKLTLDYGLRWDYQTSAYEIHDRLAMFAPDIKNPSAGGLLGATMYAGYGPGRCNCSLVSPYPYMIQPRLGVAYQMDPKTVFRGGIGFTSAAAAAFNYMGSAIGMGWNTMNFGTESYGDAAVLLKNGLQYDRSALYAASYDPGIRPSPGQVNSPPAHLDRNGGRQPRILQWSVGVQREVSKNLVVEAAYVGNRTAWLAAGGLISLNAISPERLKSFGLDVNNANDRALLTSRLDSPTAASRGFNKLPYAGYPASVTVAQSLRPYPQFGNIGVSWAPLGKSWYDSLQVKVTKRTSYGLSFTSAFTWQKELQAGIEGINDVFNRPNQKSFSSASMPFVLASSINYETPGIGGNKWLNLAVRGWNVGGVFRYASGMPIGVPGAQNSLSSLHFQSTRSNRVAGQPLFLKDLNCHCIDPNKDFVLNPAAWSDPAAGQWGTAAAYYNDYRQVRRYDEQLSLGRTFRIKEQMTFSFRAEFFNAFNRTFQNNPDSGNALATQRITNGVTVSGFGRINPSGTNQPPRSGQLVARFQF